MFCHRNTNQRLGSKQKASFGTATFVSARLPHMYKDLSSVAPLMGARFASPAGEALRPPPHPLPLFERLTLHALPLASRTKLVVALL